MLEFRKPNPGDQEWINQAGYNVGLRQNDAGFVNISLLTEKYNTHVCNYQGTLLRFFPDGYLKGSYAAPVGETEYKEVIPLLEKDATSKGLPFRLELLTEDDCRKLEASFPDRYEIIEQPDFAEYLHRRDHLSLMSGKKFSAKRNHISQFYRKHPDANVVPITKDNLKDAYQVARQWLDAQPQERRDYLEYEYRAILKSGENWDNWGLKGIIVYADGMPVGMSIASELSEGVYDVHFEKALEDYPHVWSLLVRSMADYLSDGEWINREEDLGDEGLRHSKLSYRPDLLLKKYTAVLKEECS